MRSAFSMIDLKLAVRMLVKHPALSLVGGLAIALALLVGTLFFELLTQALHPAIPLPAGQEIVGIRQWDAARHRPERRVAHDVAGWRAELRALRDLTAFRSFQRNLVVDGAAQPLVLAEINASGFRLAQVEPQLGRLLRDEDEVPGAAPVIVLGHEIWRTRFRGAASIVGSAVHVGETMHTVVGVMPEGFAFPVAHDAWVPLPAARLAHPLRQGPALQVMARLAPGGDLAQARAELDAWSDRAARTDGTTRENLRPELLPFAESVFPLRVGLDVLAQGWSLNLLFVLLALLTFANVGMLVFARTAAREGELVVRSALGASRGRIVTQLFVEALVLGGLAVAIGVVAARWAMQPLLTMIASEWGSALPFWFHATLSPRTLAHAIALGLLGCLLAGVLPALKTTRGGMRQGLQQASAGGGGLRFGGVWTLVIVAQIAVTMTFPVALYFTWRDAAQVLAQEPGIEAQEYLVARLEMDRFTDDGASADAARMTHARAALERVLELDPAVAGVTFATQMPTMYHPWRTIELDDAASGEPQEHRVGGAHVASDFFATLQTGAVAGRLLRDSDAAASAHAVVVNEAFVARVLGGRNAVGRRLRYRASDELREAAMHGEPWFEIVGVVPNLGMGDGTEGAGAAGLYHALGASSSSETDTLGTFSSYVAVHVKGDPAAFAPRLQAAAASIDPALRLYDPMPLADVPATTARSLWVWFKALAVVSGIALLLAWAGIYAVMSFTVARRRREIGIRVALGASHARLALSIFAAPMRQMALGIGAGAMLAALLVVSILGASTGAGAVAGFLAYSMAMIAVCLLACIAPTRRALAVQPQEALRDDG